MTAAAKGVVRVDIVSDTVWYVNVVSVDSVHAAATSAESGFARSERTHSVRSAF